MSTEQCTMRLVEYMVLVGPEQKHDEAVASYCSVSEATLLRQFPEQCCNDCCVSIKQVAFFCQPRRTYSLEDDEIKYHTFMLTDTETNKSLYGVCYTFPCEVTTVASHDITAVPKETVLLSVCLLSQHFFLNFFQSCLEALAKLIDQCYGHVTWLKLFYPSTDNTTGNVNATSTSLTGDIENWINKLVNLELPAGPGVALELTVDLGSPLTLTWPPPNELPLCDLSVRQLFQHLQPHNVNEILRLILNEQKVVICSQQHNIVSKVVLTLITLLYPLEYVYPVIPLLPARLNQAADFLMVPVPYLIGTTTDLIAELAPSNLEDVYLVNIDTKEIKIPEIAECLPQLPLNSLDLQANIKKILDSVQTYAYVEGSLIVVEYQDTEKIDMLIRRAFLEFMMSPQILGLLSRYQTIIRLFPRSVIKLRPSCLLQAYSQSFQHENTNFIERFMTSQSVGYFLDWNLSPTNTTYLQYLQPASGKVTFELWGDRDRVNKERVGVSLVDANSSLHQFLLQSAASTVDNCTDYSSEEEYECPLSPLNSHQEFPNMVMPDIRLPKSIVTMPKTKISDHYHTCQQWVEKLLEGKGITYLKAQHKQVLASDASRTELLLLVERGLLGCSETSEVLHNTTCLEVAPAVFNKLLHIAQLMVKNIDKDYSKNPHSCLSSAFILLRLSCLVCLKTSSACKKPSNDEVMILKSPVLPCGDRMTPFVSSVSSNASSSDDDMGNDLPDKVTSCSSGSTNKLRDKKFLHHDLFMTPLSQSACFTNNEFWRTVFLSTVTLLREKLGWDEKTSDLYQRYSSIGKSGQQEMAEKEDELLSSVLINLATFMNITGVGAERYKQLITNLVTYSRLGHRSDSITSTLEERTSGKDVKLIPLYVKKSVIFMAHLGRNKLGTACKVEVWESVLILRTISDNGIILRVWRDSIGTSACDTNDELVVLHYKDVRRPPVVLHTKQFGQLHEAIIT